MLIDTFVNAIFLYDDKMEITYNYHEGTTTITFEELQKTIENQALGSDINSVGAPTENPCKSRVFFIFGPKYRALNTILNTIKAHPDLFLLFFLLFPESCF